MNTDTLFSKPISKQFEFDADVAAVFDDMLVRSVPFYKESQALTRRFAANALSEGGIVYDLGCSTASMLLEIERSLPKNGTVRLVGIDNSAAMIEHARKKTEAFGSRIELVEGDILTYPYEKARVVISNYTLQFIRPMQREGFCERLPMLSKKGECSSLAKKSSAMIRGLTRNSSTAITILKRRRGTANMKSCKNAKRSKTS